MLRWFVLVASRGVVVIALTEAIYVLQMALGGETQRLPLGTIIVSIAAAASLTAAGTYGLRRVVSTAHYDGDEREYMIAAWLCGVFGVLLIVVEGTFEFQDLRYLKVQFIFEDLLLGAAALCALSEEVRLFKRTTATAEELTVFRNIMPPRKGATDGDAGG